MLLAALLSVAGSLLAVLVSGGSGAAPGPRASLSLSVPDPSHRPVAFVPSLPTTGESATSIPSFAVSYASEDQASVPVASLTKLMVAYVTLSALPLAGAQNGPSWTVTPTDVATWRTEESTDQSSAAIRAGEVLTERQLLEGLLVHSANDYAAMLGELVAGSDRKMVAAMNHAAVALGLRHTHYVDVSGYQPQSRSDAVDLLHLTTRLMGNSLFRWIVRHPSVKLPVAGVVWTYTPLLGQGGVVGVKTGYTSQAGGCDVMAYEARAGGVEVLVVTVVLGEHTYDALDAAGQAALRISLEMSRRLRTVVVTRAGERVGSLGWATRRVPVVASATTVVPWFTAAPAPTLALARTSWPSGDVPSGATVATATVRCGGVTQRTGFVTSARLVRPRGRRRVA